MNILVKSNFKKLLMKPTQNLFVESYFINTFLKSDIKNN